MWETRALELNNQDIWNWSSVCNLVRYASLHGFNTIVVGQADLFGKLVSPKGYTPFHYNDSVSSQQRARCIYLNRLAMYCREQGLRFYLQAKELDFPTELLLSHKYLLDNQQGILFDVDFWSRWLTDKIRGVCQGIPALTGLIIALSSTDGLLPITRPKWDINARDEPENTRQPSQSFVLYRRCFQALSQVVTAQNKHLVLRVFPASNDDLGTVLDAIEPLPPSVSVSIKLTPERFWPAFPNNPALLQVTMRDVWVDIDLAGEEVGWGVMPFLRIDELKGRLLWCQSANPRITGAICKTSWESVDNHWIPETLSECNLFACSQLLGHGAGKTQEQLLDLWLAERYGWCPDVTVARRFQQLLEQATEVLYQAIYVRDHVFHRHSQLPESYGQAVWSLYSQLARNHWLPGSAQDIHFTRDDPQISMENLTRIAQEKDEVAADALKLCAQALEFAENAAFPTALYRLWQNEWRGLALYCQLFTHAQKAFFTLHFAREVENSWSMREICHINVQALYQGASEMEMLCQQMNEASPGFYIMFDAGRVRSLADSLSSELSALRH
ncbi:hypothetical protein [Klebsiella michiganensis]|uniref:hypothetical protein n=1 Tax=Klebsiella michiganensis TaxID=1134687 RepID=UPI0006650529|nr:hypothetical protein [Klebsiella michiganensis]ELN3890986.1 hypothetical protein [Klebsiella michiganensis]ELS5410002.1 hypothetical protein [Klebsiella michiganensis]MCW9487210.1 hypothetical protein [Klebsiella michiganensis]TRW36746.1 hypothetical protein FNL49_07745 [Klebsiella michiganensis]TRW38277.1 hypothetical protein FNL50_09765 [Klebsiella michiganensis]